MDFSYLRDHGIFLFSLKKLIAKKKKSICKKIFFGKPFKYLFSTHYHDIFYKPLKHFFSIHYQNSSINSYVYKYIYVHTHVISCILFLLITRTVACQAPLSIEYSGQKQWSQLLFPSQGDLPDPKIKPVSQVC